MCDTLILHNSRGNPFIFGKNSDRHPEEPQALVYIPAQEPKVAKLGEGIEYPDMSYDFLLSKPSWIDGGEMGLNNRGLAIGNEVKTNYFPGQLKSFCAILLVGVSFDMHIIKAD